MIERPDLRVFDADGTLYVVDSDDVIVSESCTGVEIYSVKWVLAARRMASAYRGEGLPRDDTYLWKTKCNSLAASWRKRAAASRLEAQGKRKKKNGSWKASVRTMLSQWHKRHGRIHNQDTRWKQWANNKASAHRKRMREPNRKRNLQDAGESGVSVCVDRKGT